MNRFGVLVLLASLGLGTATARADGTTGESGQLPNGATLSFQRIFLHEDNSEEGKEPKIPTDSLLRYFNLAHCVCAQPNGAGDRDDFFEKTFEQELKLENSPSPVDRPLEFWGGTDCLTELDRDSRCSKIAPDITSITNISSAGGTTRESINTFSFINARPGSIPCDPDSSQTSQTLWAMADLDGNGALDFAISKAIDTDIKAPTLPTNFKASGAEDAIELSWTPPADTTDVFAYQALCTTLSDAPAREPLDALYQTGFNLCGASPIVLQRAMVDPPEPAEGVDAATEDIEIPEAFSQQQPAFICGQSTEKAATGLRIEGLKNNTSYKVALLIIDRAQNARGVYFPFPLTPKPVVDFWEDLHDRGSKVEGGFCLIADTYGDQGPLTKAMRAFRDDTLGSTVFGRALVRAYYSALAPLGALVHGHLVLRIIAGVLLLPLVAFALAWHLLTLPGLLALVLAVLVARKYRVRWLAKTVPAALALLVASPRAHAQTPYWETMGTPEDSESNVDTVPLVRWHVGVRLGPYTPDIDKQLGMDPGPYHQIFTKPQSIVPMLDVDRVIWRKYGQLTVGGSLGFLGNSNHAYTVDGTPGDPNRPRSPSDTTSFRLIPLEAAVGYRFTYLDDEYGVPVVPYIRGGLAYYVWWITKPDGSFAAVCQNGGEEPCSLNKARGASLGVQASIGLQLRAERIDATAARSMRDSGIQHAGFYAELSLAQVDGFGSDKKLSVGDRTWFAGVDFEF